MGANDGRGPVRRLFRLGLGRPDPVEAVDWEVEHHVDELVDRLVAAGWDPDAARTEAERRFGPRHVPRLRRTERRRVVMERGWTGLDFVRETVGRTGSTIRRQPGFVAAVVLTLALGIGANAAMFSILDRLLLSPPEHVVAHEELRRIVVDRGSWEGATITYPDFLDFRAHDGFEGVAAFSYAQEVTVGSGPEATPAPALLVSHDFFPVLRVAPVLGRTFSAEEDRPQADLTVVVSHEYWQRALGADRAAMGRTIELAGVPATVIGVAPPGFTGVNLAPVDLWLPIEAMRYAQTGNASWRDGSSARGNYWLQTVARLREPSGAEAAAQLATALHRSGREAQIQGGRYPETTTVEFRPLITARGPEASDEARVARWLGGVSMIVLLIACANVANLLLARGARRRREVAVRLALGISRGRLVSQMMLETVGLALLGGAAALALAHYGGTFLRRWLLPDVFFPASALDGRLVLFVITGSVLAGLLAGCGPALQSTRVGVSDDLREGSRGNAAGRSRIRSGLMVAQAAMSVVLLVGAGLFVLSLRQVRGLDLGLDADAVVLAVLETVDRLGTDEQNRLYEEAVERTRSMPGVQQAAAVSSPFQWAYSVDLRVPGIDSIPDMPGGGPYYYTVTPGYFETLGQRIVRGRGILDSDVQGGQRVAVVNQAMADSLWSGNALGQCLYVGEDAEECSTVVGVVEDASRGSLQDEPYFGYYLPSVQVDLPLRGLYLRAADGDGDALARAVAAELRAFSPRVRFATVETLRDILDPQARSWTLGASMFTLFGLLALVVAAVGLYSLLAFEVAQRTRELGIRSALGADRARLLRSVLVDGLRLGTLGVAAGLTVAWLAAPRVGSLLFQVSPREPGVLAAVALLLIAVAAVAALVPGLRATRVDPASALRSE